MGTVANWDKVSFLYISGSRRWNTTLFLRDTLGITVQHVARTNEPVVIRRYNRTDVINVALWEWRWLKQIETAIRDGEIDDEAWLAQQAEIEWNLAG